PTRHLSLSIERRTRRIPMIERNDEPKSPIDALAMLKADHQRVRDLFQEYAVTPDPQAQRVLAEEACTEIDLHAQMEEEILYPVYGMQGTASTSLISQM